MVPYIIWYIYNHTTTSTDHFLLKNFKIILPNELGKKHLTPVWPQIFPPFSLSLFHFEPAGGDITLHEGAPGSATLHQSELVKCIYLNTSIINLIHTVRNVSWVKANLRISAAQHDMVKRIQTYYSLKMNVAPRKKVLQNISESAPLSVAHDVCFFQLCDRATELI